MEGRPATACDGNLSTKSDSLRRRCCVGRTRAYGLRLLGLFYLIFGLAFEKR